MADIPLNNFLGIDGCNVVAGNPDNLPADGSVGLQPRIENGQLVVREASSAGGAIAHMLDIGNSPSPNAPRAAFNTTTLPSSARANWLADGTSLDDYLPGGSQSTQIQAIGIGLFDGPGGTDIGDTRGRDFMPLSGMKIEYASLRPASFFGGPHYVAFSLFDHATGQTTIIPIEDVQETDTPALNSKILRESVITIGDELDGLSIGTGTYGGVGNLRYDGIIMIGSGLSGGHNWVKLV